MRRAVVTGGAGFVGSHLCERLVTEGWSVVVVDSFITGSRSNLGAIEASDQLVVIEGDVSEGVGVDGSIDAVLHLASPASPADYLRFPLETLAAGAEGTRNALELARREGARFLLASTSEVYGDPHVHPQTEGYWGNVNPIGPRSVYDEAKRYAEALTMAYQRTLDLEVRVARIFNTYGPRMKRHDGRAVPTFIDQALRGEPMTIHGDGMQTRSLCYVTDLVDGLFRLLASNSAGPVNLGNPEEVTIRSLAERVREIVGSDSPILEEARSEDDPMRRRPDIAKAARDLNWSPTIALGQGLERTVVWAREAWVGAEVDPARRD